MQRDVYARLAEAASLVGHLHFFRVVDVIPLPSGPLVFPEMRGSNTFITPLPDWIIQQMVGDIRHFEQWRDWVVESEVRMVLRIPKAFAYMVSAGRLQTVGTGNCNKFREDVSRPWWGIGWDKRGGAAEFSHVRQIYMLLKH